LLHANHAPQPVDGQHMTENSSAHHLTARLRRVRDTIYQCLDLNQVECAEETGWKNLWRAD